MPNISQAGLNLIESFEGCSLHAYWDSIGQCWTIGYGHTGPDVTEGETISESQANLFLAADVTAAQNVVDKAVEVVLNPNQYAALVSFVYNVGADAFQNSTLLRLVNQKDFLDAADEFNKWVYGVGADGQEVVIEGLVNRRRAEKALFLAPH